MRGLKRNFGNDGRMGVSGIILIHLPMVSLLPRRKAGSKSFLKQGVPTVSFIGKNVVDSRNIPLGVSKSGGNLTCGQVVGDCLFSFSCKKTLKNLLNNERLLRMGKKFSVFQSVAKGGTAPQKRPVFHPFLVAPPHILGDGGAFLLSGHGQQGQLHLSQHLGGIDALFLKNNDHAQVF